VISWRDKLALRPREVAEVLSISERQVHRLIADGELQTRVVGRARLVLVASVLTFASAPTIPTCQQRVIHPDAASAVDRFRRWTAIDRED
jgi:excisionase family DNA binding protein